MWKIQKGGERGAGTLRPTSLWLLRGYNCRLPFPNLESITMKRTFWRYPTTSRLLDTSHQEPKSSGTTSVEEALDDSTSWNSLKLSPEALRPAIVAAIVDPYLTYFYPAASEAAAPQQYGYSCWSPHESSGRSPKPTIWRYPMTGTLGARKPKPAKPKPGFLDTSHHEPNSFRNGFSRGGH